MKNIYILPIDDKKDFYQLWQKSLQAVYIR